MFQKPLNRQKREQKNPPSPLTPLYRKLMTDLHDAVFTHTHPSTCKRLHPVPLCALEYPKRILVNFINKLIFTLFMQFSRQEYWSGLPFPSLVDHVLTMPKPLIVWVITNSGKFFKRWEYQTTLLASWEICMQVKKHQLELDVEQQTGSKLRKEYF